MEMYIEEMTCRSLYQLSESLDTVAPSICMAAGVGAAATPIC